ncbi:MAG: patatin-like phospholipase family protein [Thermoleophilaceae bacterium]|nr:patatin-like phospholipase family protein [Thermoleophilaceae bacterium]MBA3839419.1 patatin-like phospholipase family protein [Thermoleophilaceae bacterium]
MPKVVSLEKASGRPTSGGPGARRRRRRPRTALVLGGGGVTGGVYEIGALRAFDLLAVNRTANDFDVYVGTSAGAMVASLAANGVTPEEMMRVINQQAPTPFRELNMGSVLRPNYRELARTAALMPLRLVGLARQLAGQIGTMGAMDLVLGMAEGLPSGLYDGSPLEAYLADALDQAGRTNDFRGLAGELYVTATDLDNGERVVFGGPGNDDVPISEAVAASAALPMVFRPREIRGRHLVDGGIRSTTNLDLAVERGAKLILVINPLVPYVNDLSSTIDTPAGTRVRRISEMGFAQIGYQSFKLLAHQRLHEAVHQWKERYPGVDILLIEPDPNDELMFETNILNFTRRVDIARHGFESVTMKLARDYERLRSILSRHDIEISLARVRRVTEQAERVPERTRAWRRIFEQTTGALLRQSEEG